MRRGFFTQRTQRSKERKENSQIHLSSASASFAFFAATLRALRETHLMREMQICDPKQGQVTYHHQRLG
jgi:dTDP-4-dehydrorhamnose 3,5-epimerase-like enzyme